MIKVDKGVLTERDPWWSGRVSPAPIMQPAIVRRSSSPICCGVSRAWRRQPSREIVVGEMWARLCVHETLRKPGLDAPHTSRYLQPRRRV